MIYGNYISRIEELKDQIAVTSHIVIEYSRACKAAAKTGTRQEYNTLRHIWGQAKRSLETKQEQLADLVH